MSDSYFTKQFKNGEEILEVVHPVWIAHLPMLAVGTVLTLLPFFLLFYLFSYGERGVAIFFLLLAIGGGVFARTIFLARRNGVLITRERIVDIEQRGFFHKVVSDTPYSKIEESRYEQRGPFAMMFGYGTVVVETKGSSSNIEIRHARDPKRLHEMIESLIAEPLELEPEQQASVDASRYPSEESAQDESNAEAFHASTFKRKNIRS